ncbi:endonuclease domain-containing protein [Microlunatus elymi]|uniref:endonuclease domain-containing protein n=1 Tax=Microlunatus elymi TaxID=2596828 RepID=UPI00143DE17E|nr:DUF559 domain-containing protein [Microlunatus elymi]
MSRTRLNEIALAIQAGGGVIRIRDHPQLEGTIRWLARDDRLVAILPGIFTTPDTLQDPIVRITAVCAWASDGVIVGPAAARISFWPTIRVDDIGVALRSGRAHRAGIRIERRTIPPDFVRRTGPLAYTCPALTAIDLVRATGVADAFDIVLRERSTTLAELREVFDQLPNRRGNQLCAELIEDSRDEPWSPPERDLHRLMRTAGITGWVANRRSRIGTHTYAADLRFSRLKLAIEVDGYEVHSRRDVFENDRARNNDFVLEGWTVLHFTPRQIADRPDWVIGQILRAIEMLAAAWTSGIRR